MNSSHSLASSNPYPIRVDVILVPQGSEAKAVYQGLKKIGGKTPQVLTIPLGIKAVSTFLEGWEHQREFLNKTPQRVLVMGLCGGLSSVSGGEGVLYQGCGYVLPSGEFEWRDCHPQLTDILRESLSQNVKLVKGITSDRVIELGKEKQELGARYGVDVVDMEGFPILERLSRLGIEVAMIRVCSDDSKQDLPLLSKAINEEGQLSILPLTVTLLKHPLAAIKLIQNALRGLRKLREITEIIFNS